MLTGLDIASAALKNMSVLLHIDNADSASGYKSNPELFHGGREHSNTCMGGCIPIVFFKRNEHWPDHGGLVPWQPYAEPCLKGHVRDEHHLDTLRQLP